MRLRHVGPILAFLSVLAVPLAAQNGAIRGQVVDSVTQQGLVGATIQIVGQPRQTASGADGNFTLSDVPAGAVTLKVTRIGYGPQTRSVRSLREARRKRGSRSHRRPRCSKLSSSRVTARSDAKRLPAPSRPLMRARQTWASRPTLTKCCRAVLPA